MDHYTDEKLLLERHAAVIRTAERRARLLPASEARTPRRHLALWLHALADRIDDRPGLVRALP